MQRSVHCPYVHAVDAHALLLRLVVLHVCSPRILFAAEASSLLPLARLKIVTSKSLCGATHNPQRTQPRHTGLWAASYIGMTKQYWCFLRRQQQDTFPC